jgi:hypothetical protein
MFIVLVYLGTRTPPYVFDNLRYLRAQFPEQKIVFISDSDSSIKKAKKIGVYGWLYREDSSESTRIKSNSSLPMGFRDGFWFTTTSRFFALSDFMTANPNASILQVEADVWLSPNFPFEKFEALDTNYNLAFPLESEHTGAASLLYIRDEVSALLFTSEVRRLLSSDSSATDMTILGQLYKESSLKCLVLPSIPKKSPAFNPLLPTSLLDVASERIDYFQGVFDAVTYGLYLSGEDARNHRGKKYMFRRQENHLVHCDKMKFTFGVDGAFIQGEELIPLFNIHIHSKDRRVWDKNFISTALPAIIRKSALGESMSRDYLLTLKLMLKSLKRRMLAL